MSPDQNMSDAVDHRSLKFHKSLASILGGGVILVNCRGTDD